MKTKTKQVSAVPFGLLFWWAVLTFVASIIASYGVHAETLVPTISVTVENPSMPIFHGVTNLPDGSELMLTLSRPESGYMAQAKMTVTNGHFTTEQFSADDKPINAGSYKIEVLMPIAEGQPEAVRAVIGDHGQNMKGKLVVPVLLGLPGVVVDYVTQKQLGGPANATLDNAARMQSIEDDRKQQVSECTSNIDYANSLVRSGAVTGPQIFGTERQQRIAACTARVNAWAAKINRGND